MYIFLKKKLKKCCFIFESELIQTFRKLHLFDIDIPGGITFQESKTLSPGNDVAVFDTSFGRFGIGICYDVRFASLSQIMAARGAQMLVFPVGFSSFIIIIIIVTFALQLFVCTFFSLFNSI